MKYKVRVFKRGDKGYRWLVLDPRNGYLYAHTGWLTAMRTADQIAQGMLS